MFEIVQQFSYIMGHFVPHILIYNLPHPYVAINSQNKVCKKNNDRKQRQVITILFTVSLMILNCQNNRSCISINTLCMWNQFWLKHLTLNLILVWGQCRQMQHASQDRPFIHVTAVWRRNVESNDFLKLISCPAVAETGYKRLEVNHPYSGSGTSVT